MRPLEVLDSMASIDNDGCVAYIYGSTMNVQSTSY